MRGITIRALPSHALSMAGRGGDTFGCAGFLLTGRPTSPSARRPYLGRCTAGLHSLNRRPRHAPRRRLLATFSPDGHGLLDPFLDGFNDEVAQRAMHRMPGFEDAREVLVAEAHMYEQQHLDASAAHEAAWQAIAHLRDADVQAHARCVRANRAVMAFDALAASA